MGGWEVGTWEPLGTKEEEVVKVIRYFGRTECLDPVDPKKKYSIESGSTALELRHTHHHSVSLPLDTAQQPRGSLVWGSRSAQDTPSGTIEKVHRWHRPPS